MSLQNQPGKEPDSSLLITLDATKNWIGIDNADEDSTLTMIIEAVAQQLDGPGSILGRSLAPQTLKLTLDDFPLQLYGSIELKNGPVSEVESITYLDTQGMEQTLPDTDYAVWSRYGRDYVRHEPKNECFPQTNGDPENVQVIYQAGSAAIPKSIQIAAMMLAQNLYDHRDIIDTTRMATTVEPSKLPGIVTAGAKENPAIWRMLAPHNLKPHAI